MDSVHRALLKNLCDLPTAPYQEEHVIAYVLRWAGESARRKYLKISRDPAGNVYLEYQKADITEEQKTPPLVIEAHMDHPGFKAVGFNENGELLTEFRGSVKPSYFDHDVLAGFWTGRRWAPLRVRNVRQPEHGPRNYMEAVLEPPASADNIQPGCIGTWYLPDAEVREDIFAARVCDDLAGCAAALSLLEELIAGDVTLNFSLTVLLTRAEEVGFAGALAVCQNKWIPKNARVIGLETSKASNLVPMGSGPIIRVGDRQSTFSAGLTSFICQCAGHLSDEDSSFLWQRKLMDAGMCDTTAFTAYGYDAAGITLPLGNYHNMRAVENPVPDWVPQAGNGLAGSEEKDAGKEGGEGGEGGIGAETIHLRDFENLVRILVEVARRFDTYEPDFAVMKKRLEKLHQEEQAAMLYQSSDQPEAKGFLENRPG